MNKWTIGLVGLAMIIVCGDQFKADKNLVIVIMAALVLVLLSTEKNKG